MYILYCLWTKLQAISLVDRQEKKNPKTNWGQWYDTDAGEKRKYTWGGSNVTFFTFGANEVIFL